MMTGGHLCEAEDVVDEEKHILTLDVTEVLCNGESSQRHTGSGTWGFVHLPKHQRAFALASLLTNLVDTLPSAIYSIQNLINSALAALRREGGSTCHPLHHIAC